MKAIWNLQLTSSARHVFIGLLLVVALLGIILTTIYLIEILPPLGTEITISMPSQNIIGLISAIFSILFVSISAFLIFRQLIGRTVEWEDKTPTKTNFENYLQPELEGRLDALIDRLERVSETGTVLNSQNQEKLLEASSAALQQTLGETILSQLENRYGEHIAETEEVSALSNRFRGMYRRLIDEKQTQSKRAIFNLFVGVAIAAVGVYVLYDFVFLQTFQFDEAKPYSSFGAFFVRLSIVILIEIFALFFLRLYKAGLDEIKYIQNELTNLECKYLALEASILTKNKTTQTTILKELAQTERNFILKKGETTIGLKNNELESEGFKSMTVAVGELSKTVSAFRKKG